MGDAANPRFSVAERNFLTEKKCAWVAGAASRGRRKEELVESNAAVTPEIEGTWAGTLNNPTKCPMQKSPISRAACYLPKEYESAGFASAASEGRHGKNSSRSTHP